MKKDYSLLIVGGGPIGLACALEAKKHGIEYLIGEPSARNTEDGFC